MVLHLGIGTGNMEEGALRADTNISVRKKGEKKLGTKVELKNINSFKFVADAIDYEAARQIACLEHNEKISQETRSWDQQKKQTFIMRSKEEAADYRYFHEPDLPTLTIEQSYIDTLRKNLPELPDQRFNRYLQYGLSPYEATILVDDLLLAHYYDRAYTQSQSKALINWLLRDVIGYINEHKITLDQFKITPVYLAELVSLIDTKVINATVAKEVFEHAAQTGKSPSTIVTEQGLTQITDEKELEQIIMRVIAQHQHQVADYKNGNTKLFGFLVGQTMKETQGKGNPQLISTILKRLLQ
jgi:aspartyl-tRNA(Asn)/glutamyl-tRNA(Gln) amidotransferase subunit B